MKRFLAASILIFSLNASAFAGSMFDENGNYSGNWKQMTNTSSHQRTYSSTNYTSSAWYAENKRQRAVNAKSSYSNTGYTEANAVPFRYNTLNYTRLRKVKGGYGDYNAKCSDIGDASFCR